MKKIFYLIVFSFLNPFFLISQNYSGLLVNAIENLPGEEMVIAQSTMVKNLEIINSEQLDYSPVILNEGILFTSNRELEQKSLWKKMFNKKSSNLFFAEKIKEGHYKNPVPFKGNFTGKLNDGAISMDGEEKIMVYTVNENYKSKGVKSVALKLYYSEFKNGKWTKGQALTVNADNFSTCHPSLSKDGKTLFFVSDRPGGYGGMDIYMTELVDGKLTEPVNLGPAVNTSENEVFPFINNNILYFSSNGRSESSDLDIYFSKMDADGEWTNAMNMGKPFNSNADDFGFALEKNGLNGMFSSNRDGGKGADDLYFWRIDQSLERALDPTPVKFTVTDDATGDILPNADVTLIEFENKDADQFDQVPMVAINKINQSMAELLGKPFVYQTDENGNFYHDLKHDRNYMLIVEQEDYTTFRKMTAYNLLSGVKDIGIAMVQPEMVEPGYASKIDLAATEEIDENGLVVNSQPMAKQVKSDSNILKEGQRITLNNIYYEFNKAVLKEESTSVLDETVEMMKNFPEMEIDLVAHTDSRGKADYNKMLSQQRANSARDYLISKGIDADRIVAKGIGEEELLNDCMDGIDCSEEMHSINRRTDIVITKLNQGKEIFVKKE